MSGGEASLDSDRGLRVRRDAVRGTTRSSSAARGSGRARRASIRVHLPRPGARRRPGTAAVPPRRARSHPRAAFAPRCRSRSAFRDRVRERRRQRRLERQRRAGRLRPAHAPRALAALVPHRHRQPGDHAERAAALRARRRTDDETTAGTSSTRTRDTSLPRFVRRPGRTTRSSRGMGRAVYLGPRNSRFLVVASTATNKVVTEDRPAQARVCARSRSTRRAGLLTRLPPGSSASRSRACVRAASSTPSRSTSPGGTRSGRRATASR